MEEEFFQGMALFEEHMKTCSAKVPLTGALIYHLHLIFSVVCFKYYSLMLLEHHMVIWQLSGKAGNSM